MLKQDEVQHLLDYKTTNQKFIDTQLLIRLNSILGLRIDELLNVEVSDVHFKEDHLIIYLGEDKKGRSRNLPIDGSDNVRLVDDLKKKIKDVKKGKLFPDTNKDDINFRLKTIARLSKKFDEVPLVVKNVGVEAVKVRIPKHKMISTHSFRRFAVTRNAKKHGLLVAQFFSGHEDLQTFKKHYLDDLSSEEILDIIRTKVKKD